VARPGSRACGCPAGAPPRPPTPHPTKTYDVRDSHPHVVHLRRDLSAPRKLFTAFVLLLAVAPRLSGQATKPAAIAKSGTPAVKPVWPDEGPLKWAPRPTVSEITANDLRTRLYQFADDSMMGRKIGELGNLKGTAYIAAEFKRLGLKPGGDNGT
jgi:hypothetical protein